MDLMLSRDGQDTGRVDSLFRHYEPECRHGNCFWKSSRYAEVWLQVQDMVYATSSKSETSAT